MSSQPESRPKILSKIVVQEVALHDLKFSNDSDEIDFFDSEIDVQEDGR